MGSRSHRPRRCSGGFSGSALEGVPPELEPGFVLLLRRCSSGFSGSAFEGVPPELELGFGLSPPVCGPAHCSLAAGADPRLPEEPFREIAPRTPEPVLDLDAVLALDTLVLAVVSPLLWEALESQPRAPPEVLGGLGSAPSESVEPLKRLKADQPRSPLVLRDTILLLRGEGELRPVGGNLLVRPAIEGSTVGKLCFCLEGGGSTSGGLSGNGSDDSNLLPARRSVQSKKTGKLQKGANFS